jgi:hypothetical protein
MLDDIDYSDLTATSTTAAPTSEPKKKSNIADRSVVKKQDKSARKEIDVESLSDKAKQIETDLGAPQIPDALAQYGLPALGALGALGTAYGVYKSMQNKAPTPDAPMAPAPAAGPDYSAYNSPAYLRNAPVAPPAPVEAAPAPQAVAPDRLQQAQQIIDANKQLGIGSKPVPPTAPVAAPVEPPGPVATPFSAAPPGAAAPEASAQPNSPTTSIVNNTVKEMIDEVDKPPQGIYRDAAGNLVYPEQMSPGARAGAEAFAQQYPEQAAALEAEKRFAILGAGAADNNLYNAYGAELRKEILKEVNQGQPAGVYSNYTSKINPAIKAIPPESALGKQLEDLRVNQPKSATRGSLGVSAAATPTGLVQGSKIADALKNAGKVALVMSMADAANAATKGDYTGAAKIAGPALDPTGILEAAVNPQSTARNITNVSPVFGFLSQLIASQADQRAKKAYVEKVNRAVPPPMR